MFKKFSDMLSKEYFKRFMDQIVGFLTAQSKCALHPEEFYLN